MKLIHVFHTAPSLDPETTRRNALALQTRSMPQLAFIEPHPLRLEDLPRKFPDRGRDLVFVKDIIEAGVRLCQDGDYVCLSNEDTCFNPALPLILHPFLSSGVEAMSGPRRDFKRIERPLTPAEILQGAEYTGTDIFIFKPSWWLRHRNDFPDMILGAEMWDHILRGMMRLDGMPRLTDAVYHEVHASRWTLPENRSSLPSQRHCQTIGNEWMRRLTDAQRAVVNRDECDGNAYRENLDKQQPYV